MPWRRAKTLTLWSRLQSSGQPLACGGFVVVGWLLIWFYLSSLKGGLMLTWLCTPDIQLFLREIFERMRSFGWAVLRPLATFYYRLKDYNY
jgi:hypothetical protein